MGKRIPLNIGGIEFTSKKAAIEFIRAMVRDASLDCDLVGDDMRFASSLLTLHYDIDSKVGVGLDGIFIRQNIVSGRTTRGFWIRRLDGTEIDFSWVECLNPTSHRQKVLNAMRCAVEDQVFGFKQQAFAHNCLAKCWLSGDIVSMPECDVHHDPSFLKLATDFVSQVAGTFENVRVESGGSITQFGDRLRCNDLLYAWREYHATTAVLHIVNRVSHQSIKPSRRNQLKVMQTTTMNSNNETFAEFDR